jgi:hypothetical protein
VEHVRAHRVSLGHGGVVEVAVRSRTSPMRRITPCERSLRTAVKETISSSPTRANPSSTAAIAASVA